MEGPIGRIFLDQLRDGEGLPDASPQIDEDLLEIFPSDVVPQRQFADPSQTVDPENGPILLKTSTFPMRKPPSFI